MNAAQYLIDTSALARLLRGDGEQYGWDQAAAAGLIATCPITELEFLYRARSAPDRARGVEDLRAVFGWVRVDDRAYDRAWQVQDLLTQRGQHRGEAPVDLILAATAELQGLTLLHRDRDFESIAAVTGQALQWYGPDGRQVKKAATVRYRISCPARAPFPAFPGAGPADSSRFPWTGVSRAS